MRRVIVFCTLLLLVGCTSAAPAPTVTPSPSPLKIALVMKTLTNPFFVSMEKGARRAETELGIQLLVKTAAQETSIEQQIAIIETLTQQKVDAIVIAPGDSKALVPALKKAQDAGIVVVNIDNQLDPEVSAQNGLKGVVFISVDNAQGAYLAAKALTAKVTTPTNAIILEGIRTAKNAEERKQGALKAFAENPNIKVVANETANWKIDEAFNVTKMLFEKFPDVKVVFAANDMMALGVVQYLSEAKKPEVMVGGFDALTDALDAIKTGKLQVTVDQQAAEQGYTGVVYAVRLKKGEALPPLRVIDVKVITAENVGK